ncbi:MAG: hypothetical protein R2876_02015 [Eubacteriales bacterium]
MKVLDKDKATLGKALYELTDEEDKEGIADNEMLETVKEAAESEDTTDSIVKSDDLFEAEDNADAVLGDLPVSDIVKGVNEIFTLYDDVELSDIPDEVLVLAKDGNLAAAFGAYKVRELKGEVKRLLGALQNSKTDENAKLSMGEVKGAPKNSSITQKWLNYANTKDIEENWDRIYPLIKSGKLKAF